MNKIFGEQDTEIAPNGAGSSLSRVGHPHHQTDNRRGVRALNGQRDHGTVVMKSSSSG